MNILQLISSSGLYGAESVVLALSRMFNSSGHRCVLGVFENLANPNRQLYERAVSEGIDCRLITCKGQIDRGAVARIREFASKTEADIVHSHGYKADIYSYVALRKEFASLVSTCHNWIDDSTRTYLYGVGDRYVLRHFGAVVAVSDGVQNRLLRAHVPQDRICLIRNGIDVQPFSTSAQTIKDPCGLTVGLVGRLSHEKGVDIFIHAAAKVLVKFPKTRFVAVGEGPDRQNLQKLIDDLKIGSQMALLGRRDDMPSVYHSLDLLVSSSRTEGLPIALLEGMAAGLPVIATAVGEVPSLIHDGHTGVLLPPGDPAALASAIVALLTDSERRTRLGNTARSLVEKRYSSQRMAADYLSAYHVAIGSHSYKTMRRLHRPLDAKGDTK